MRPVKRVSGWFFSRLNMAFVPARKNTEIPKASQEVYKRDALAAQRRHREAIATMRAAIDNKWGRIQNGSWSNKRPTYPHIVANLKRAQLDDERAHDIENENFKLLEKLSKILERSQDPTQGTREWGNAVRLTATQVPVIDHCVPANTTTFGAAIEAGSLNFGQRVLQQTEIVMENHKLVKRIQQCKPTYDRRKQLQDAKERERWLINRAIANRPLDGGGRPPPPTSFSAAKGVARARPHSAAATLERPRLLGTYKCSGSSAGSSSGAALVPVGGAASDPPIAARPPRPQTARPAKVERRPSEQARRSSNDASVLRVLDKLASQRTKIGSLRELREQKELLMEGEYEPPADVRVTMLEASGIVINVTTSARCAPPSKVDEILVLVHGGLFMSGSPRTCQHLASKLCDELNVPVATPVMRLAPEHPFPAALEDLQAAYGYLATYGIDPTRAAPPPSKLGVFAESSGGNLAALLIQARLNAGEPLPCCIFMSSPWLDLSCSGGSFMINEPYDLMMRKDRMLGIAKAYLASACDPSDPMCSPLRKPSEGTDTPLFAFPPTLIHVDKNELLLDDAITFCELAKRAGTDAQYVEFDQVLHGWHTYFPMMPQAMLHLREAVHFIRDHLTPSRPYLDALAEVRGEDDEYE